MFPPAESPVYAPHSAVCVHLCPCSRPTLSLLTRHHDAAPSCWPDCTVPPAARDSINNDNYHSLEISGPQYTECYSVLWILWTEMGICQSKHTLSAGCLSELHIVTEWPTFLPHWDLSISVVLSALGVDTITVFTLVWWWRHPGALIGQSIRVQISSNHVR